MKTKPKILVIINTGNDSNQTKLKVSQLSDLSHAQI